jgi:AraC-like DNA-binding protein
MDVKYALYSALRFNFLYVDRYVFRSGWIYPASRVPYCMVRYILKGEAVFTINGTPLTVHENQVVYIPEGCILECTTCGDYFEFISIRFNVTCQMEAGDFLSEYFHIQCVVDCGEDNNLLGYFRAVYTNAISQNTGKMFRIRGNLELIIAWLAEHAPESLVSPSEEPEASFTLEGFRHREGRSSQIKQDPRIQVVVDYMIAHPMETYDAESLSLMANMSPSSLRRLFKEHTGRSPGDFLKELRMATAARRLLVSNERISAIAYNVGFEDPNYFARRFKERFGVSPQTYRKIARE